MKLLKVKLTLPNIFRIISKKEKSFEYWTIRELKALPNRGWDEDVGVFDRLIILPQRKLHESGFRCMDFVAVKRGKPFCRLSGCSDVINIDGIGGFGEWSGEIPKLIPPKGWSIDCLKKSGLLSIFTHDELKAGAALSSFELYAVSKKKG